MRGRIVKRTRAICLFACLLAVLAPGISQAETIAVTGAGSIADNKSSNVFVIGGSGFSFVGGNAGSNGVYCGLNTTCVATAEGDASGPWSYRGFSGFADVTIRFVSDPFTIHSFSSTFGPIPAMFTGVITADFGDFIIGTIAGTGTVELTSANDSDLPVIYFPEADFNFDGSATFTAAPEPGSLFLVGSGMLALLGALGRKARAQHCR
jgi:PEP-CTERM motif